MQMVLEHFGYLGYSQESISKQFLIVPDNDDNAHSQWGTQIRNDTINDFFVRNDISLREKYTHISHFVSVFSFEDEIDELIQKNVTIICGFNYSWLFGNHEDTFRHVSIIVDFNTIEKKITLLDPGPKDAGYKEVTSEALFQAIKAGSDGLWCITKVGLS